MALLVVLTTGGVARAQTPDWTTTPDSVANASPGSATNSPFIIPNVSQFLPRAEDKESISASLQILVLLTLLTLAPSILLMMTSFVRMLIVLVLLRQALGTQSLPPSQVLIGLALFMTFLSMGPTWERVHGSAIKPYLDGEIGQMQAIEIASGEMRNFMFDQIEAADNARDVYMMHEYATRTVIPNDQVLDRKDVPMRALAPAFVLSELKVAFIIGFKIYLPFLVIDMVIATVLVSMGMMMLPPVLISLPFKLLLFVLADGWRLIAGSLMASVV
ncbi:MAG: flagellar type III secretion system pore protein FliP [Phycisphaerales bacterium]|nr:flagellar type III secretion system pore protein FliP [Phycisphaerales bacterium]